MTSLARQAGAIAAGLAVWLCVLLSTAAASAVDVRLLMVEQAGCRFCAQWDGEVGAAYAASPEGGSAPLTRLQKGSPELSGLKPATYTPTFIVVAGAIEAGRITGYPGKRCFWGELREPLQPLGFASLESRDVAGGDDRWR